MSELSSDPLELPRQTDFARAIGWALFLAASWTWCIGMFLPVLLVRDFGLLGWIIFAIPNVIGALLMGWMIQSRAASLTMTTRHAGAMRAFSIITISFHTFFIPWIVSQLLGALAGAIAFGLLLVFIAPIFATNLRATTIAGATIVFSLVCAGMILGGGTDAISPVENVRAIDLASLSAVCLLGFLTCPWLDLTFHRARQECSNPTESRFAFTLGFGMFFSLMIVLTLLYAPMLLSSDLQKSFRWVLSAHLVVQSCFTLGVHGSALRASVGDVASHQSISKKLIVMILLGALLAIASRWLDSQSIRYRDLTAGELTYRAYMTFYALIFPAYVWLVMHPSRGFRPPGARPIAILVLTIFIALPFYFLAFMNRSMQWGLIGVMIVLLARLLQERERRDWLAEQRAAMKEG